MNRRIILLLLITAGLLISCGDKTRLQPLANDAIILAFGDSLTYGTGVSPPYSYPSVLSEKLKMTVINAGVPGEISENGLKRLPRLLAEHQPQLVILCHGGNDILRRLGSRETKQNLKAMIELIQRQGAQVVLVGVPEFGLFPSSAPYYEALADELNLVSELDIIPDLETEKRYKSDAVHFNQAGYALFADALYQLLKDHYAIN